MLGGERRSSKDVLASGCGTEFWAMRGCNRAGGRELMKNLSGSYKVASSKSGVFGIAAASLVSAMPPPRTLQSMKESGSSVRFSEDAEKLHAQTTAGRFLSSKDEPRWKRAGRLRRGDRDVGNARDTSDLAAAFAAAGDVARREVAVWAHGGAGRGLWIVWRRVRRRRQRVARGAVRRGSLLSPRRHVLDHCLGTSRSF